MAEKIIEAIGAFAMKSVGPGGDFEIGMDTWNCGGNPVTFRCFKGPAHTPTLGDYFRRYMLSPTQRNKEFIVYENERYTFAEVFDIVSALAHVLKAAFSVQKGDRVCIAMRNYPEWCFSFMAATAIGCVAVPVNGWWGPHELEYGLQDSGSKVLICDRERYNRASHCLAKLGIRALSVRAQISGVASFDVLVESAVLARKQLPDVSVHTDDPAAMMYTSGTTGHPKGVVLTHRGITNQMTTVSVPSCIPETMLRA